MLLISVDGNAAFFDTVSLDGEPILAERYSACQNVAVPDI